MNWTWVTFLGDSTLLLPASLIVFAVLLLSDQSRRIALSWAMVFGATGLVVSVSKLLFMGWGIGSRELDFTGFSGHTALSTVFWPVFLWVVCCRFSSGVQKVAVVAGYLVAALVGYSRLMVNAHSQSEVILGWGIGALASVAFFLLQRRYPAVVLIGYEKLTVLLVVPVLLFNTGMKAPTQSLLESFAVTLGNLEKPYTRADLHRGLLSL
ncbi:TPA: phosphatase PAP2 family protein [Klebsiella quasipneumoniae]|uniref:phosphatase PAP2 family protein n=1 Tax=Enterobacteriaceae TaxID=543 RepID=UPI00073D7D58|nr:phosphatase PAP2 family protein [Entomohabitans teleogrylli]